MHTRIVEISLSAQKSLSLTRIISRYFFNLLFKWGKKYQLVFEISPLYTNSNFWRGKSTRKRSRTVKSSWAALKKHLFILFVSFTNKISLRIRSLPVLRSYTCRLRIVFRWALCVAWSSWLAGCFNLKCLLLWSAFVSHTCTSPLQLVVYVSLSCILPVEALRI